MTIESDDVPEDSYYDEERNIVVGPSDVDRQLGIIAYHERTLDEAEELARKRKADIDTWLAKRKNTIERKIAWHVEGLQSYLSITKQKSMDLPNGKIYKRKQQPSFIWPEDKSDEYRVMCAKYAATEFTRKSINIDKKAVKDYFKQTGEIIDGVEVVMDEPDKFHYSIAEHLKTPDAPQ